MIQKHYEPSVRLRPMAEADLELVLGWRNHPDVRQHMYTRNEICLAEHICWFRSVSVEPGRVLLILEVNAVRCGYVNFRCDESGQAVWGFYLAPNSPKGTGKLLGQASIDYGFDVLGLEKIWGEVLPNNLASQNFHLRHGFVLESIIQGKTDGDQKIGNVRRYLLTRSAWRARQGRIE